MSLGGKPVLLGVLLALLASSGGIAGRALAHGRGRLRPALAAAGTASPEPGLDCRPKKHHLSYHGGALVTQPSVFVLFWGASWGTDPEEQAAVASLVAFLQHLGESEYPCTWHELSLPAQEFGAPSFAGDEIVPSDPPTQHGAIPDDAIQALIVAEIDAGRAPAASANSVYVVVPPKGLPVNVDGDTGCGGSNFKLCAYHDSFARLPPTAERFRYAVIPYPCGGCFVEASESPGLAMQETLSHELSETATDPDAPPLGAGGWFEDRSGDEDADICTNRCDVAFPFGGSTHIVNSLWSNDANTCVSAAHCETPPPACTGEAPGDCVANAKSSAACAFEWHVEPNLSRRDGLAGNTVRCADGQPFCDADGATDGACTFRVAGCLASADPRFACSGGEVSGVTLASPKPSTRDPDQQAAATSLLDALRTADPGSTGALDGAVVTYTPAAATPNACTDYVEVRVPVNAKGSRLRAGRLLLRAAAASAAGGVVDQVTLSCDPSWP